MLKSTAINNDELSRCGVGHACQWCSLQRFAHLNTISNADFNPNPNTNSHLSAGDFTFLLIVFVYVKLHLKDKKTNGHVFLSVCCILGGV